MVLIGSDFHPSWQQVSWLNQETGETGDVKLVHEPGAVEKFYVQFPAGSRVGMEATGNCQWFVELMASLGHEVLIGDAAKIRASDARQQKHDKRDARLLVQLLAEERFPQIWVPSREQKDLRQLLIHRYKLVRIRAQVKNGLQHLAMNQGVLKKHRLWSKVGQQALCELPLSPWASRRRKDLLKMMNELDAKIDLLDQAVAEAAEKDERATADDPAGRGADHVTGIRADDGGCFAISARKTGGELFGTDSAGVQFGWASAIGIDQQTGKFVFAHAAGGSRARSSAVRSGISE
jgi:transposase